MGNTHFYVRVPFQLKPWRRRTGTRT